jgi:hypothetical protein
MKVLHIIATGIILAGCQSLASDDPGSLWFRMPSGTELVLNRALTIPAQRAHIMLQHGKPSQAASQFDVACRFEVKELGPRTIQPDTFLVTGYSTQERWENYPNTKRYYKVIRLESKQQPGIMTMVCEYYDYPIRGRPVTLVQIQEALGDYFSFRFP